MKEKGPEFRIIGKASEETKEQKKSELESKFKHNRDYVPEQMREKLDSLEYKKTDTEKKLISFANRYTSKIMEDLGVSPFNIPLISPKTIFTFYLQIFITNLVVVVHLE